MPLEAVMVVDTPLQIVVAPPPALIAGSAFTIICIEEGLVNVPVVLHVPVPVQVIVQ